MSICRLRVPLPDSAWIASFSRAHPTVRIEVLGRLDLGHRRSLTELLLHVPEEGPWAQRLRAEPRIDDVQELEAGPGQVHLRLEHQTSALVPVFQELHLMRRFPFAIQAGEAAWVVVATPARVRALLARLRSLAPGSTLESVRHAEATLPAGSLTPRQSDLLRRALAAGYFEVPRKITLTDLAKNLGMAPSSLSEGLAIVEKKLLEGWPAAPV